MPLNFCPHYVKLQKYPFFNLSLAKYLNYPHLSLANNNNNGRRKRKPNHNLGNPRPSDPENLKTTKSLVCIPLIHQKQEIVSLF